MRKILVLVLCAIVLMGCNVKRTLSYEEVAITDLKKSDEEFYEQAQVENGVYLFYDTSDDKLIIYFNTSHESQEEYGMSFANFDVKGEGETLQILYDKEQDDGKSINYQKQQLYEVQLDKEYKTIELFENGDIAAFTSVFS